MVHGETSKGALELVPIDDRARAIDHHRFVIDNEDTFLDTHPGEHDIRDQRGAGHTHYRHHEGENLAERQCCSPASVPIPKFAFLLLQARLRTSESKDTSNLLI